MFGVSGTALGAILRAKGHNYKDLALVGLIYSVIVLLIALFTLILGTTTITTILPWIPESTAAGITVSGLGLAFVGAILAGISGFVALILGGVVFDASEAIIKGLRE